MKTIEDKGIVITGAGSGIGKAIAFSKLFRKKTNVSPLEYRKSFN